MLARFDPKDIYKTKHVLHFQCCHDGRRLGRPACTRTVDNDEKPEYPTISPIVTKFQGLQAVSAASHQVQQKTM